MIYNKECVTCALLRVCTQTSAAKILSHFSCASFEGVLAEEEIVKARCDIINLFGTAGLMALAPHMHKDSADG